MPGLLNWIRASRQRTRERLAEERAHLSAQEQREVDHLRGEHSGVGTISPDRDFGIGQGLRRSTVEEVGMQAGPTLGRRGVEGGETYKVCANCGKTQRVPRGEKQEGPYRDTFGGGL